MAIKNTPLLKLILSCPDALLESLTIEKLILYIRLASHLRREILHVQKPTQSEEEAPVSDLLPTNVKLDSIGSGRMLGYFPENLT
jgi:hypothetical protein